MFLRHATKISFSKSFFLRNRTFNCKMDEQTNDLNEGIQSVPPPRYHHHPQRQRARKTSTIFFNELTKKTKFFLRTVFHLKLIFSFRINKHRPSLPQICNPSNETDLTSESDEDNQTNIEHIQTV